MHREPNVCRTRGPAPRRYLGESQRPELSGKECLGRELAPIILELLELLELLPLLNFAVHADFAQKKPCKLPREETWIIEITIISW
jgi:hypothetical protein